MLIRGSLIGNATNSATISARGQAAPTTTADLAIVSLTVLGCAEYAQIVAGVDTNGVAKNADAQIGAVSVVGDWIASSLAAGAVPTNPYFGDADDVKMSGGGVEGCRYDFLEDRQSDHWRPRRWARSAARIISASSLRTSAPRIGGTPLVLALGNSNDNHLVGITGDFTVREI